MKTFIDEHRDEYGVESICREISIAPATYYEHKARERDPRLEPTRVRRDNELIHDILMFSVLPRGLQLFCA